MNYLAEHSFVAQKVSGDTRGAVARVLALQLYKKGCGQAQKFAKEEHKTMRRCASVPWIGPTGAPGAVAVKPFK